VLARLLLAMLCSGCAALFLLGLLFDPLGVAAEPAPTVSPSGSTSPGALPTEGVPLRVTPSPKRKLHGPSPTPSPKPANYNITSLRAHQVRHQPGLTIADGNVIAIGEGFYMEADHAEIDYKTNIMTATGHCRLMQFGDEVMADKIIYHMDTKIADLFKVSGIARNVNVRRSALRSDIYFWGQQARWDGNTLRIVKGAATTCDLGPAQWHYHVTGDVITVYFGDRLEIRKARLYFGDTEVLGQKVLVFDLRNDKGQQHLMPSFGQSQLNGFYGLETLHYLHPYGYGLLHLDYYQKAGFAYGIDDHYALDNKWITGYFHLYELAAPPQGYGRYELADTTRFQINPFSSVTVSLDTFEYKDPVNQRLTTPRSTSDYLQFSTYSPKQSFGLGFNYYQTTNFTYDAASASYRAALTSNITNRLDLIYSTSTAGGFTTNSLHTLEELAYRGNLFDSQLDLEATSPGSLYYVNRLPEVMVRSHPIDIGPIPLQFAVGGASIYEFPSGAHADRSDVEIKMPDTVWSMGSFGSMQLGAGFKQLAYSNGDAQFIEAARADWIQDLSQYFRFHVDYHVQEAHGFTPVQSDYYGNFNALMAGIELKDQNWANLSVDFGRDLMYGKDYDIIPSLKLRPVEGLRIDLAAAYDPNFGNLMNFQTNVRLPLTETLSVQNYNLYDTINRRFTYRDFMIQKDNHDFVTSFIYRSVQNQYLLQFSLKAFSFDLPEVGPQDLQPVLPVYLNHGH
jgi:hypothetical protein